MDFNPIKKIGYKLIISQFTFDNYNKKYRHIFEKILKIFFQIVSLCGVFLFLVSPNPKFPEVLYPHT
jgi:hypothetical protein